jgi:hypothetical protein
MLHRVVGGAVAALRVEVEVEVLVCADVEEKGVMMVGPGLLTLGRNPDSNPNPKACPGEVLVRLWKNEVATPLT